MESTKGGTRKRRAAMAMVAAGMTAAFAASSLLPATAGTSSLPKLKVAMDGSSITVGGAEVSGANNVVLTVTNERMGDAILFHLRSGVSEAKLLNFLSSRAAQDPNAASRYGSIVFDAEARQGKSHVQTMLSPGNYVALDGASGPPSSWPHTSFTITKASTPAQLPTPDSRVKAIEFGFRGSKELKRGQLVRFKNKGWVVHMVVAIKARNLSEAREIRHALKTGNDRKVRRLAVGFHSFMDPVSHGAVQQEHVYVGSGYWVLACFMDTQDGREHTQLGMERVIHVSK